MTDHCFDKTISYKMCVAWNPLPAELRKCPHLLHLIIIKIKKILQLNRYIGQPISGSSRNIISVFTTDKILEKAWRTFRARRHFVIKTKKTNPKP